MKKTISGAMYKIGKVVLINVKVFEDYLEKHRLGFPVMM